MAPSLADKKVVVYGLAKSGLSAINLLLREQARVIALDQRTVTELGTPAERLTKEGVTFAQASEFPSGAASDAVGKMLRAADLIVVSPGVPLSLRSLQD